jgi:hypothetical protein
MEVVRYARARAPEPTLACRRKNELAAGDLGLLLIRAHSETLHDEVFRQRWHRVRKSPCAATVKQIELLQLGCILEQLQPDIGVHLDIPVNTQYMLMARLSRHYLEQTGVLLALLGNGHLLNQSDIGPRWPGFEKIRAPRRP